MNNEELYNFLLKIDVLPADQLERLKSESEKTGISLEDLIFSENIFSEPELLKIRSVISGLPKADLHKKVISTQALSNLPENISREYGAVCFLENEEGVHVACYSADVMDKLSKFLPNDKKSLFYLDSAENIKNTIKDYQESISEDLGFRVSNLSKKSKKVSDYGTENFVEFFPDDYLMELADDIYTKRIIDLVIEDALLKNCDSVSIVGEHQKTKIKYRVGSKNITSSNLDADIIYPLVLNLKKQADLNISEEKVSENGYFISKSKNEGNIFVLFNILKTFSGYRISLNISRESDDLSSVIESMIQSPIQIEKLYKKLADNKGLFVLTGESKSGKTRTFYNLIKMLQRKNLDVISIEKNPEIKIFGVSQIAVNKKGKGFSKYIQKASDQNPDVLALSEIYKNDLVKVLNQVSTGKIVLSEYRKGFSDLFVILKKLSFSNETLDRIVSASISHKLFKSYTNLEKTNLTKKEIAAISKILPELEAIELLKSSGAIDKRINKLIDVSFHVKSRKSKKNTGDVYVRGVLDIKEDVSLEKDTKKTIEVKIKRAILENALIMSVHGIVDIKEILKFIK